MLVDRSKTLIWIIVIITSVVIGMILLFDSDKPSYYSFLPLLPLTFGLINMLFFMLYKDLFVNIGIILIIGLYYIRSVIVPFIMFLGNYSSFLKFNIEQNMSSAISLMIYELIIVYLVVYLSNKKEVFVKKRVELKKYIKYNVTKIFGWVLFILFLFNFAVWVLIPESRQLYSTLLTTLNKTSYEIVSIDSFVDRGNIKRAFLTLYVMIMEIIRVLIPVFFMLKIRKKIGENLIGIFLSIPLILLQFFLVSNTHARSIICAVVLLLLLVKLYPSWARKLYKNTFLFGLLFVVWYFWYKSTNSINFLEYTSEIINSYFSGPDNIAAIFNVLHDDQWRTFVYTMISAIPFNSTIFGFQGSNYSTIFNYLNNSQFQIGPLLGESYYFFGAIFSPISSAIFASLAVYYGKKAYFEENFWVYVSYVYLVIFLASSLILYNGTIFLKTFGSTILPIIIIAKLARTKGNEL